MNRVRNAVQIWAVVVAVVAVQSAAWGSDISAGYYYSCGVNAAGAARCWGNNPVGNIGNGTTGGRYLTPVTVSGLGSGVASISAGDVSACAVTTGGAVRCWGSNGEGQLGAGLIGNSNVPVQVSGLTSGVRSVQVGSVHACAVTTSGLLFCWGANYDGQLGVGSFGLRYTTPVQVPGLSGVTAVALGELHTCALLSTGAVRCFGSNSVGQIGTGVAGNAYSTPQQPTGLASGVRAITTGNYHSCALMSDGTARCWGINGSGELGDGTNTQRNAPTTVRTSAAGNPALTGVTSLSAGGGQTCAVAGSAFCWGFIGDSWYDHVRYPTRIGTLGFSRVEAGEHHACGRTSTNTAFCWGRNMYGELGNNSTTNSYMTPVQVVGL